MIKKKLIEKIRLSNGLDLELLDGSRVLAGDRWLVSLEARIEMPVDRSHLDGIKDADQIIEILRRQYGEKVVYSYTQERHFVDEKEKESVFNQFKENVKNILSYLSHPNFVQKALLARYRDLKRKVPWLFQR